MTIGIDVSRLAIPDWTGVEYYTYEILCQLMTKLPTNVSVVLYTHKSVKERLPPLPPNWQEKRLRWPPRRLWTQLRLSLRMFVRPPDILFIPGHVMPLLHPKNTVAVIHDIAAKAFPETYTSFERWYTIFAAQLSMRFAKTTIVPSEFTKKELLSLGIVSKDNITVIPHGFRPAMTAAPAPPYESYFLMLGRLETKKNVVRAMRAFTKWKHETGDTTTKLILAGKKGIGYEDIALARSHSPEAHDIIVKGYVSEAERSSLLQHTKALLYPSLYEGFGLPILEAFAVNTPVITSRGTSTGEVAGDGALLVDALSVDDIARAMSQLDQPGVREALIAKGRERVVQFSWEQAGEATAKALLS